MGINSIRGKRSFRILLLVLTFSIFVDRFFSIFLLMLSLFFFERWLVLILGERKIRIFKEINDYFYFLKIYFNFLNKYKILNSIYFIYIILRDF